MTPGSYRFDRFLLDRGDRQLRRDGVPLDLNARYFDALVLLVSEQGRLVSKDRFLDEVWQGVPVTDEALTQCIKMLRRHLGDDASRPRFIETVPKHGYRFVAPVDADSGNAQAALAKATVSDRWRQILLLGAAGTIGGGLAGLFGGIFYGFAGASEPLAPGMGAVSVLLVLICLTILVAVIGAAGVAIGIAAGGLGTDGKASPWMIAGGALGGLVVGAVTKLLGLDAFQLLLGQSPGDITGATEGLVLGGAVGLGAWLASRQPQRPIRQSSAIAAAIAGVAGLAITLLGGELMGGSLELLSQSVPGSRLSLERLGTLVGEQGFGPISRTVTGGLEGALFGGFVVAAMLLARRHLALSR